MDSFFLSLQAPKTFSLDLFSVILRKHYAYIHKGYKNNSILMK